MVDFTVTLPEEYAPLIDDWTTDHLRGELLRNGLLVAADELLRVAELGDFPHAEAVDALSPCIEKLQWLQDEMSKLIPESER